MLLACIHMCPPHVLCVCDVNLCCESNVEVIQADSKWGEVCGKKSYHPKHKTQDSLLVVTIVRSLYHSRSHLVYYLGSQNPYMNVYSSMQPRPCTAIIYTTTGFFGAATPAGCQYFYLLTTHLPVAIVVNVGRSVAYFNCRSFEMDSDISRCIVEPFCQLRLNACLFKNTARPTRPPGSPCLLHRGLAWGEPIMAF